jgi:uncharacterized protein YlxP (DUF503 family)
MVVGVVRLALRIPHNRSLKGKRSVVKRVIERTRTRFNVSIAEVGEQDVYGRADLGCVVVGSDHRYVNGALDKILDFIAGLDVAEIVSERIEIVHC